MPDAEAEFPELEEWIAGAIARGDTHMLVLYDFEDFDEFASYVHPGDTVEQASERLLTNPYYKILAAFDLRCDIERQLAEYRARYCWG